MKNKLFILLATLFVLAAPASAQHLALGAGVGTDGISVELAAPLGKYVQVRAGYGFTTGLVGVNLKGVTFPVHPGLPNEATATVPLNIKLGANEGRLLFSFHPGGSGFHITAGVHMGSSVFAHATFKNMPSDYNMAGLNVDNYMVRAHNGELAISLSAPGFGNHAFAVKPYAGIGYGRAVGDGRVGFSVDLGVQYQGEPTYWAEGESLTGRTHDVQITKETLEKMIPEFNAKTEKYTKLLAFWPTLSAHLYVKLF